MTDTPDLMAALRASLDEARARREQTAVADARWTEATEALVRRHIASASAAILNPPGTASPYDISIDRTRRLLAALADAGLLVEPGGGPRRDAPTASPQRS